MIEYAISALLTVTAGSAWAMAFAYHGRKRAETAKPYRLQLLKTAEGLINAHGDDRRVQQIALQMIRLAADPRPDWHEVTSDGHPRDGLASRLERTYGEASDEILTGICLMVTIHFIEFTDLGRAIRAMALEDPLDWVNLIKASLAKPPQFEVFHDERVPHHAVKRGLPGIVEAAWEYEGGLIPA